MRAAALIGKIFYDGEGRRVKKKTYGGGEEVEETVFTTVAPKQENLVNIAKIVSSNSHIDYIARVGDTSESSEGDRWFGQFVGLDVGSEKIVGVIYDSRLVNPEYGSFGPRLAPKATHVNPDFVHEPGILIGILLLGAIDRSGKPVHGIPPRIVPPGQEVAKLDAAEVVRFHSDGDGGINLHYYSQIIANAGQFAIPLLGTIIDQLAANCSEADVAASQRPKGFSCLAGNIRWNEALRHACSNWKRSTRKTA